LTSLPARRRALPGASVGRTKIIFVLLSGSSDVTMTGKKGKIKIADDQEVARYAPGDATSSPEQASAERATKGGEASALPAEGDKGTTKPAEETETVESLRARLAECEDKLLRSQAEVANTSKRLRQQHAASLKLAGMDIARDLLPVVDNFHRTLSSLDESAPDDPIVQGVRLIADQLDKVLKDRGVEAIQAVGQPFDPTLHEAMMQDRESDMPPGTVTREFERGYKMNDRVLRPAKVAVAADTRESEGAEEASPTEDQVHREKDRSS
jgi:molecular chaperone GrpE